MVERCKKIAASKWFQNAVTFAILVAAALVGMATYKDIALKYDFFLYPANKIILSIFTIEIVVKIIAEGNKPLNYFKDAWNVFDFIIVAGAFIPFAGNSITILRLLRLLRVLKLIKALPKLQLLVNALLKSIPSMGYVFLLLLLLFYIYAVCGVFLFGENDPIHFKNLQISLLSLFRVVTLEDWTDIMYINMFGCENYGYDNTVEKCINSIAKPKSSVAFFVSFVLIGTMIFLNLFIGVIINGIEEAKTEHSSEKKEGLNGNIEELEFKVKEIQKLLSKIKTYNKNNLN